MFLDGVVTDEEAAGLYRWVKAHPDVVDGWPGNVLYRRLADIFDDGVVTDSERLDLAETLEGIAGGEIGYLGEETPAVIPLNEPPPSLRLDRGLFVFSGRFAFGPRKECQRATVDLGGLTAPRITMKTDYLVIGTFVSRDWIHSSFGRKIEKAVQYRKKRGRPAIISEDHWAQYI